MHRIEKLPPGAVIITPPSDEVRLIDAIGQPLHPVPPLSTFAAASPWPVRSDPIDDIKAAVAEMQNQPYQPDTLICKVVDRLPKTLDDGAVQHWEIRGATLLLSSWAYDECKKLPEGTDWYHVIGRLRGRCNGVDIKGE